MIDHSTLVRWKALADKSLDEGSPEPERVASARALAKEVSKIDLSVDAVADTIPSPFQSMWEDDVALRAAKIRKDAYAPTDHAFDPHRCGACNHDADSHTAHARNGTCFECTLRGAVCTRTKNEILGKRPENEPAFGRPTRPRHGPAR